MGQDDSKPSALLLTPQPDALAHPAAKLDHLIAAFLGSLDVADSSRAAYRRNLRPFLAWLAKSWGGRPVTREALLAFKQHLRDQGRAGATISNYLSALRLFFSWAEKVGLAPNIAADVSGANMDRHHRKDALTEAQVVRLLNSLPRSTQRELRDFAIINLLVMCGLRTIEVVRSNLDDIRTQGSDTLLWVRGKGHDDKDAFVVLADDVFTPIMQYLGKRPGATASEPLFAREHRSGEASRLSTRTIRRLVKLALRRIDLNSPRLSAHSLRHSAITLAMHAGADIYEVKGMARHKSLQTTMIYLHMMRRLETAAEKKLAKYMRGQKESFDGEKT